MVGYDMLPECIQDLAGLSWGSESFTPETPRSFTPTAQI